MEFSSTRKRFLSKLNYTSDSSRLLEREAVESLIDTFDIIRELKRENWIGGSVPLYREEVNPSNIAEVVAMRTAVIGYDTLLRKLFTVWNYIPFRQFNVFKGEDFGVGLQGKRVMRIESHADDDGLIVGSIIRLEDMIAMLHTMEKTPFRASKLQSPSAQQASGKVLWTRSTACRHSPNSK